MKILDVALCLCMYLCFNYLGLDVQQILLGVVICTHVFLVILHLPASLCSVPCKMGMLSELSLVDNEELSLKPEPREYCM